MTIVARSHLKLDEFLPYRLSLASNAVSQVIARAYEEHFGLKMHEWRVITVLAQDGELTQQEIVGRTKMDKVTVSRAAQVLERRKLLRRVTNADDGRSLRLSLTAEGQKLYARVVPAALELEAEVLEGLSEREISELKDVLHRLEAAAERVLSRR
ncbi:DNA-binding MarR family transcriptional regulator [Archangium gephyra]|uniref:DNA-binding MarR family transcriptional regulator n=1 Tax=Archangium gephyra TaxID=48 RepID=A0AAC8QBJ1_9BACT|nr:MarR family transcriptional regulator [Archangium gephyra]AKJ04615.1 Transcriptional regulator, MarR family [Archangium gephyra]REG37325.1 DNA-binding MarR family transcriptional regulator [Archangium gephyra]